MKFSAKAKRELRQKVQEIRGIKEIPSAVDGYYEVLLDWNRLLGIEKEYNKVAAELTETKRQLEIHRSFNGKQLTKWIDSGVDVAVPLERLVLPITGELDFTPTPEVLGAKIVARCVVGDRRWFGSFTFNSEPRIVQQMSIMGNLWHNLMRSLWLDATIENPNSR